MRFITLVLAMVLGFMALTFNLQEARADRSQYMNAGSKFYHAFQPERCRVQWLENTKESVELKCVVSEEFINSAWTMLQYAFWISVFGMAIIFFYVIIFPGKVKYHQELFVIYVVDLVILILAGFWAQIYVFAMSGSRDLSFSKLLIGIICCLAIICLHGAFLRSCWRVFHPTKPAS